MSAANPRHGWSVFSQVLALSVVAMSGGLASAALADEFKVENAVYMEGKEEPSSQSVTIFRGGDVYDCMKDPAEVVILDKSASRFILLDLTRNVRAELTTADVSSFCDRMQQQAAKSPDPVVKFLAEPKFLERYDEAAHQVTLNSPWVNYRLLLAPEANKETVEQYREFCDWYARLNALLVPEARLPFGRLAANAVLAERQAMPSKVFLAISSQKGLSAKHTRTIRSEHRLVQPLTPSDLERVAQLRTAAKEVKLVTFDQYRKADKTEKAEKAEAR